MAFDRGCYAERKPQRALTTESLARLNVVTPRCQSAVPVRFPLGTWHPDRRPSRGIFGEVSHTAESSHCGLPDWEYQSAAKIKISARQRLVYR